MTTLQPRMRLAGVAPKPGEPPEGCQDAVAADVAAGRFAVADGATTSFLAAPWARLLVERFRDAPAEEARSLVSAARGWPQWLRPSGLRWRADAEATVGRASERKQMLLQNRLADGEGAAATFVGVRVDPSGAAWEAVGIGDSCLLHVREGRLARSFPLVASAEFDATPDCLFSNRPDALPPLRFARGELREGDLLLLATDALAKWLLRQHEAGPAAWDGALDAVAGEARPNGVPALVDRLRAEGAALDDDVGVLVVALERASGKGVRPGPPPPPPDSHAPPGPPRERRPRRPARIAPIVRLAARRPPRGPTRFARAVAAWAATALVLALAAMWMGIEARRDLAALGARAGRDTAAAPGAGNPGEALEIAPPEGDGAPASRPDTLRASAVLWRGTAAGAPEVGRLLRDVEVERHPGAGGRDSITFLAWLAATQGNGDTLVRVVGGRAAAPAINARATPALGDNVLVSLDSPAPMELVAQERANGRLWYRVRVSAAAAAEEGT